MSTTYDELQALIKKCQLGIAEHIDEKGFIAQGADGTRLAFENRMAELLLKRQLNEMDFDSYIETIVLNALVLSNCYENSPSLRNRIEVMGHMCKEFNSWCQDKYGWLPPPDFMTMTRE